MRCASSRRVILLVLALLALAGCSSDAEVAGPSPEESGADAPAAELRTLRVLLPAESPIEYPHRVAEAAGYFAEEGITTTYQYAGGSAEVIQQVVAGNGDLGLTCVSSIVGALGENISGFNPVFTSVYGSLFGLAVPADSGITDPAELAGQVVGISDPAGGEVSVVEGILTNAGVLDDVELLAIGEAPAVGIRAIEQGQVVALGGSLSDFVALQVQGLELTTIGGDELEGLPACGIIVDTELLESEPEIVEGFLRGTAKGVVFGQQNPAATLEILREAAPEAYGGEIGQQLLDFYLPVMAPSAGDLIGTISTDSYQAYIDFTNTPQPAASLDDIIVSDLVEAANDFDVTAVQEDADAYGG